MILKNFLKFIKYYANGRMLKIAGFAVLSFISGGMEFVGIAMVYPFTILLIKPEAMINNKYFQMVFHATPETNITYLAFGLGALTILIFIIKNLFMILNTYLQLRFVQSWNFHIEKMLLKYYLYAPYKKISRINSATKLYNIGSLINSTLNDFVLRGINLITHIVTVIAILILLLMKSFIPAILAGIFIVTAMTLNNKLLKDKLVNISEKILPLLKKVTRVTVDSLSNLKELKVFLAEDYFYNSYEKVKKEKNDLDLLSAVLNSIPPFIVEILIVITLLIVAGIISIQNINNTSNIVASYALAAAAIFRLAPALNRVQNCINSMNSNRSLAKEMIKIYEDNHFYDIKYRKIQKIQFNNSLELRKIYFSYEEKKPILKNINLTIKKGEFIGIIGKSGAGKTTLVDIIMGLLQIDSGEIILDGKAITNNIEDIRTLIGYVPQEINFLDRPIRENIAWGINKEDIDDQKIKNILKIVMMEDEISKLKDGIYAKRTFSQGQKQRISLARALYKEPEFLILDEATSSLDLHTEKKITETLDKLKMKNTIIAIAHRLSTLKSCDRLIYLDEGSIIDIGTFSELSRKYEDFDKLIQLSNIEVKI